VIEIARAVFDRGTRKIRHAAERRRMDQLRRNPAVPTAVLKAAKRILIVCHGNIIRSAFAARLLAAAVGEGAAISISSGGLSAAPGSPSPPNAVSAATNLGIDLSRHASAALDPDVVANADLILVMEIPQLLEMRRRFPWARSRTFLLTFLHPEGPLEIRDPVNGDPSRFQQCFDDIARAIHPIIDVISRPHRGQAVETARHG
jgi:protein-tyrosine-phosphatase